jgi:predicted glycoside hydrolase/deacetylase ChbG (UPF0249 family)
MSDRAFVLCADDFGLTAGVSRAILSLLAKGRLTATGAMTSRPAWREFAPDLKAFAGKADLGLHFNLTCAAPLGAMPALAPGGALPPLGRVAKAALASAPARAEIAAELARQLDAFEDALGVPPDFVDGHQHVHVLPGVRGAVIDAVARRYPEGSVYLRDPFDTPGAIVARGEAVGKALVIAALALGLGRQARGRGIPVNDSFAGVSAFDPRRDYGEAFRRFVMVRKGRLLVMCHPGEARDPDLAGLDPVAATRPIEAAYLGGNQFLEDMTEAVLRPARFAAIEPGMEARWRR